MKRVMRELVRRNVINAKTDVAKIRELTEGQHKKLLTAKNTPPYIWKLRNEKRYREEHQ